MTNQEAIKTLEEIFHSTFSMEWSEALGIAIRTLKTEKDKVYGYDVKDVILIAELLRRNEITPIEAKDFRVAFSQGVAYMNKMYDDAIREQMRRIGI